MNKHKYNLDQEELKYFEKLNPNEVSKRILEREHIITFSDTDEIYSFDWDEGVYVPCEDELKEIVQIVATTRTSNHLISEVLGSIRRQTYKKREVVGENANLIPLKNVIYDFSTGKTMPYDPQFVFLSKHNVEWLEEDTITENPIDKFIEQITENQTDHLLLKEIVGYSFHRKMPFQNLFLLYGAGGNGKSVYLNIIREMLGEKNISGLSLQSLTQNRFAASQLYCKNANIFGDLPKKALSDVGILKELTGGDTIYAEEKFKKGFQFKNYAKIIASCNEVPETPDDSDGFHRRIIIINFPNSFEANPDRELLEKLITKENMFNFFLSCLDAYKTALDNNNFIRNECIEEKRSKYMHFSNSATSFIYNELELDPDFRIETTILYEKYKEYCKLKNIISQTEVHFFRHLYKLYPNNVWKKREKVGDSRQYFIHGLTFKE